MADILYKSEGGIFSYRIAGICVQNGSVLLQKPSNDNGYAFPGGHAELGETGAQTLIREFKEETGADISVGRLEWVAEIFFDWSGTPCHQLCLYYAVTLTDPAQLPRDGMFAGVESLAGRSFTMEFHWISLDRVRELELYPENAAALLPYLGGEVQHFIYRENSANG